MVYQLLFIEEAVRQTGMDFSFLTTLLEVFWVNVLLSGDNAILIALACRNLPVRQRRLGILLGSVTAIVFRLLFSAIALSLLSTPGLRLIGAVLLIWIATGLIGATEAQGPSKVTASDRLWQAVRSIALADIIMSLDNVLAIVSIAHNDPYMLAFGLLLSVPLIVWGSDLVGTALARFPVLIYCGAALLGWSAGELAVDDTLYAENVANRFGALAVYGFPVLGAGLTLIGGLLRRKLSTTPRDPSGNS